MISQNWTNILDILQIVGPNVINNDCIKEWITFDKTVTPELLSNFLHMNILTKEEYIEGLRRLVKWKYEEISNINNIISQAQSQSNFNPLLYI